MDFDDREMEVDRDSVKPHLITQVELNNLVWNVYLCKNKAELIDFRLYGENILEQKCNALFLMITEKTCKFLFCESLDISVHQY
jgi:hypothetical protein